MKKIMLLTVIALFACSCVKKAEVKNEETPIDKDGTEIVKDSVKPIAVGSDEDAHGCKSSAGFSWSELKQECVRIFEVGHALKPYERPENTGSAFIIFDGDQAEIFIPNEKASIVLERKSEGDTFVKDGWQLIPWKGYVIKKNGTILFAGE